jgi:two-component system chemotaxis sensor kinase CheA
MDDLLADFLTETNEGLAALDQALLRLERSPDDRPTLSEVFRLVHTIKGTCGFLGLPRLEKLAHAAENVLGRYRDGLLAVTPGGVTLILTSLDRIKAIVTALETAGAEPVGSDAELIAALDAATAGEAAPAPGPVPAEAIEAPAEGGGSRAVPQTIRVSVEVLEDLMMLVSELVLTRNQLNQLARARGEGAFSVPLQRLSHITTDLQEGVMKTRMQPIGNAWGKLPRLVRDLALELGKRIELEMRGAETELDRQVLELIRDPLTHMVRNSADHGVEPPEERRRFGKRETGVITLNAHHEGGQIIIEIGDDGRGVNLDRVRAKALSQGLATEAELAGMGERELMRFIFRPGFSTASAVTAVSGRGVGMDVVKTNIERIGGAIDIYSTEGKGTRFVIRIPLTLAIVSALIVEAGGERFAVPQIGVVELVRVGGSGAKVERIKGTPVLRLRDRLLPLVALAELLQLESAAAGTAMPAGPEEQGFVIVTQVGGMEFGMIVDRVFDIEEIVVKPVAPILRHVTIFSGNTILGDGSVIMILDPNGIARATGVSTDGPDGGADAAAHGASTAGLGVHSTDRTALLLFRAGDSTPKAVPLGLVSRLDEIPPERIEMSAGRPVVQYRGALMPLVSMAGDTGGEAGRGGPQMVLIFTETGHSLGLMVDAILDVVEERLEIQETRSRPGFLGAAVLAGRVTEVIDCAWWLRQAGEDWFRPARGSGTARRRRLLVVEDSAFFRQLVVPALVAAGFEVTAVEDPLRALRLRDAGERFDAIVSDIEMPGMDGFAFAREVRQGGIWQELPLVALSGRDGPVDVEQGRSAGFTDYVGKYDRDALTASLCECLAVCPTAAAG